MSVGSYLVCIDCKIEAPELGDRGYLGAPNLSKETGIANDIHDMDLCTFGSIYEGLESFKMILEEPDGAHFMKRHCMNIYKNCIWTPLSLRVATFPIARELPSMKQANEITGLFWPKMPSRAFTIKAEKNWKISA